MSACLMCLGGDTILLLIGMGIAVAGVTLLHSDPMTGKPLYRDLLEAWNQRKEET